MFYYTIFILDVFIQRDFLTDLLQGYTCLMGKNAQGWFVTMKNSKSEFAY